MHLFRLAIWSLLSATISLAQSGSPSGALPGRVISTPAGILLIDHAGDALYTFDPVTGTTSPLLYGPGYMRFASASPDGAKIGFKLIRDGGMQSPALFDRSTGKYTTLAAAHRRAGEVSFSRPGAVAFTLETELIVQDPAGAERRFELNAYSNLAPISPDGRRAAFNDDQDRIWILDLVSGSRLQVSPDAAGFFRPQWSPDGSHLLMSRLDGQAVVYDCTTGEVASLGEAETPCWSPGGEYVAFVRREIEGGRVSNSDLFVSDPRGREFRRLTETPAVCEVEPAFSADGGILYCHADEASAVIALPFGPGAGPLLMTSRSEVSVTLQPGVVQRPSLLKSDAIEWLDVPQVHQVYDTPDWFNGHWACGPTSASMLLAYWNLLPEWETSCSTPTYHVNKWGNYISERYNFRGIDYSYPANDPNGRVAYGGFGFMWSGSSPHSRMATFYGQHGISAATTDGPTHAAAVAAISDAPYTLCNGLTDAGHIVLAHGIDTEPHTFVVNDPYGDKNRTDLGYPNTLGKNAKYDWPGYNNGNKNFNEIYWAVSVVKPPVVQRDTLVDDLQFQRGFYLHNRPPAGMVSWKTLNRGYDGHLWFAYTKAGPADTCYAIWSPNLPQEGMYEILAYISISNATAAKYVVNAINGAQSVVVNQKSVSDGWLSLGTFPLAAGSAGMVRLGDAAPERGKEIVFDAIRWSYRGPALAVGGTGPGPHPVALRLLPNYPNPFNPSTTIRFEVPEAVRVRVDVTNALGQVVAVLFEGLASPGAQELRWNATGMATGVYCARLRSENGSGPVVQRMLLIR